MTFKPTLEEFKKEAAQYAKAAPTCDRDSLENGRKAVGLLYLGLRTCETYDNMELVLLLAKGYLEFAQKAYMDRDIQLFFAGD